MLVEVVVGWNYVHSAFGCATAKGHGPLSYPPRSDSGLLVYTGMADGLPPDLQMFVARKLSLGLCRNLYYMSHRSRLAPWYLTVIVKYNMDILKWQHGRLDGQ